MKEKLQAQFLALNMRERILVSAATFTVVASILFLAIWEPLHAGVKQRRNDVAAMQAMVAELTQARDLVLSGRGGVGAIQGQDRSLLAIVDQSGKENGLGSTINRMQPEGDTTVRVWLEQADFGMMLAWLNSLESTYGVSVAEAAIDRDAQSGTVRARLGLVRGAP